jgi:hypothetical protein
MPYPYVDPHRRMDWERGPGGARSNYELQGPGCYLTADLLTVKPDTAAARSHEYRKFALLYG